MFMVDEPAREAIRRAYEDGGEFAAAVEFRRHFPLTEAPAVQPRARPTPDHACSRAHLAVALGLGHGGEDDEHQLADPSVATSQPRSLRAGRGVTGSVTPA